MEGPQLTQESTPDRRAEGRPLLFRIFFFASFGFLLYQLLRIVSPVLRRHFGGHHLGVGVLPCPRPVPPLDPWTLQPRRRGQRHALFLMVIVPDRLFHRVTRPASGGDLSLGPGTGAGYPREPERRHWRQAPRPRQKSLGQRPKPDGKGRGESSEHAPPRRGSVGTESVFLGASVVKNRPHRLDSNRDHDLHAFFYLSGRRAPFRGDRQPDPHGIGV
jgi:hypothetical protein